MNAIAWMLNPPAPPAHWPEEARRGNSIEVLEDTAPYTDADLDMGVPPEDTVCMMRSRPTLDEVKASLARAAEETARRHAGEAPEQRAAERTYHREVEAAKRGEFFLPLEPGQKRRRRAGPDGQPLKRRGRVPKGFGGYVRPHEEGEAQP